jgi:hypothetical protein
MDDDRATHHCSKMAASYRGGHLARWRGGVWHLALGIMGSAMARKIIGVRQAEATNQRNPLSSAETERTSESATLLHIERKSVVYLFACM